MLIMELVDILSNVFQTLIAGFVALLAWKSFIKQEDQEAVNVQQIKPAADTLKLFETARQTTWLKKTAVGIECHLEERRAGKLGGHKWTLSPQEVAQILASGDIYVHPGLKLRTGTVSIGHHGNWLYSKRLFPDPAQLQHRVIALLKSVEGPVSG